jgi:hypothetical protein
VTQRQVGYVIAGCVTLHNVEEGLTFSSWLPWTLARLPVSLRPWFAQVSVDEMYLALVTVTAVAWGLAFWMARQPASAVSRWLVLLVQAIVLVNACWHFLVAAVVVRGYVPGLITAGVVNLPFSIYVFRRSVRERWCSRSSFLALWPTALLVHGPLLFALIWVAAHLE